MKEAKTIYFDLFFTLITPMYSEKRNENDVLHMSISEWERFAENEILYNKRATGMVLNEKEIINDIVQLIPIDINEDQKEEIVKLRKERMKNALTHVDMSILQTLEKLKELGYKLCLISNADIIDTMYWKDSKLSSYFDHAVFSYQVGYLKPDLKIYEIAMQYMGSLPEKSYYVGDGGSNELWGAKELGMTTILTEYLDKKETKKRNDIIQHADFCIDKFTNILDIII